MSSNLHLRRGRQEKGFDVAEKVVVAVKASKEIPKTALIWALTHVVEPGDCITLLVVVPAQSSGKRLWGFPRFAGDCASGHKKPSHLGTTAERKSDITDSCSQMMLQLQDVYDPNKINIKIKIVSGSPCGSVAAETKRAQANWVILDKQLRQEEKRCVEELQCNIVVMKRSQPKVLRLNLVGSPKTKANATSALSSELEASEVTSKSLSNQSSALRAPVVIPTSTPDVGTSFSTTEGGTGISSMSSSDPGTSPFATGCKGGLSLKKELAANGDEVSESGEPGIYSDSESGSSGPVSTSLEFQYWSSSHRSSSKREKSSYFNNRTTATTKALLEKISNLEIGTAVGKTNCQTDSTLSTNVREVDSTLSTNVREAISLSRNAPPGPPPLCSICQHKAPVFGKPPRSFSYAELELATGGFSHTNFLAEGGFGSVYWGILPDGQAIAVKQHKLASFQGDLEFCSEVEVLSCAQHRNVVMLIGFCIEDRRRLLVYEYICNRSLDYHLYGEDKEPLEWAARQKIAIGAARGLRYLHEECRVGCIVHRDMRPNNILITHDFEPLVGDFGLARWQPDGDRGVDTRVIGTFGYLAPEYAQSGQITEKADVYSFGVVLMELVTGRKAVDINRPKGQQCLTEWARPLLDEHAIEELVDPCLGSRFSEHEVLCMLHAASLCIQRDPHSRPRVSQVLRILEGDVVMGAELLPLQSLDALPVESRSRRMRDEQQQCGGPIWKETASASGVNMSYRSVRAAYWDHE